MESRTRGRLAPRTLNIELGLTTSTSFNPTQSSVNSSATGASSPVLSSIVSGVDPCFIGITLITMADGSYKPIVNIKLGDMVMAFDSTTGIRRPQAVLALHQHLEQSYSLITFDDGHSTGVDIDGGHRYWTKPRYAPVRDLDYVWHWNAAWVKRQIETWNPVDGEVILYNLTVANTHNYIANGDAVSNRKRDPIEEFLEA